MAVSAESKEIDRLRAINAEMLAALEAMMADIPGEDDVVALFGEGYPSEETIKNMIQNQTETTAPASREHALYPTRR